MNKNPYEILGVSDRASDEEIRDAYRNLARKYHSDNYSEGNLSSIAAEKMREIDEAYDTIIMLRNSKGTSGSSQRNYSGNNRSYSGNFGDIRSKIRDGKLDDAEMLLDGISPAMRNAEWYFLKGSIQNRRGWLEEASANYAKACRMDPDNSEYRAAYSNLNTSGAGGYRTDTRRDSECSPCRLCSSLLCADCCCECMGGDLIRCC